MPPTYAETYIYFQLMEFLLNSLWIWSNQKRTYTDFQHHISPSFIIRATYSFFLLVLKEEFYTILYHSNLSLALNPSYLISLRILPPAILFPFSYIKISLCTGSFLLPFKHLFSFSIKNRKKKTLFWSHLS